MPLLLIVTPGIAATPMPGDLTAWFRYERFYLYTNVLQAFLAAFVLLFLFFYLPRSIKIFKIYLPVCVPILGFIQGFVQEIVKTFDWNYSFAQNGFLQFVLTLTFHILLWCLLYLFVHGIIMQVLRKHLPQQPRPVFYIQFMSMILLYQGLFLIGLAIVELIASSPVRFYSGAIINCLSGALFGWLAVVLHKKRAQNYCFHCQSLLLSKDDTCRICHVPK